MKKLTSLMLVLAICTGLFQPMAIAADSALGSSGASKTKNIDQGTYDALGLTLSEEDTYDDLAPPYSTTGKMSAFTASGVYLASNGSSGNIYTLRDGLNRMSLSQGVRTDRSDDYGQLSGSYSFYGISSSKINSKNGNTTGSQLSGNASNIIAKAVNGFSGIYATSVAFDGGEGKDNYVAELRAYGNDSKTWVDGSNRKGAIEVEIYKIAEDGSWNWQRTLHPTLNSSMVTGDVLSYFTRRYVQELDAVFEIEAADVNGDGKDEIFVYCGAFEDKNGQRDAIVDVFPSAGKATKSTLKISGGPVDNYRSNNDPWQHLIKQHPVVTLAGGDIDRDNYDEIAVTISAPTDHAIVEDAGRCTVYTNTGKGGGISLKGIPELTDLSLASSSGRAMVSANCAFGNFQLPNTSIVGTALIIGGYQTRDGSSAEDSGSYSTAAYRFAYYNPQEKRYVVSDYKTRTLGRKSKRIASSYKNKGESRYRPTHAPLALACADLEGWGAENKDN